MNLLFIYRRDIHEDDSGASRTIILRENYLVNCPNINVYTNFRHLSRVDNKIVELCFPLNNPEILHEYIVNYNIDILCVPEGEALSDFAYKAVKGSVCKIVSELHTKPNHLVDTLFTQIKFDYLYSESNITKFKSIVKLCLFPFVKYRMQKLSSFLNKNTYDKSDIVVLLSQSFIKPYKRIFNVDGFKLKYINNPLSFNVDDANICNKEKTILIVSRLCESYKRISLAIKAWSYIEQKNPDWKLLILGDGPDRKRYEEIVRRKGITRVFFEGRKPPLEYYKKSSIFLMTSIVEGWGMTLTEAMQCGCIPIVMDSFSSLHDIIDNGNDGFIVKNGDVKSMSNCIQNLINDDGLRNYRAINCVKKVERFSINNIGKNWVDLYNSLL